MKGTRGLKMPLPKTDLCPQCSTTLRKKKTHNAYGVVDHYYCRVCKQVILPEELAAGKIIHIS